MKRTVLFIVAVLLLCLPDYLYAQGSKPSGAEGEIWQVGRDYFDAWENSNVEKMKTVLHPKATLFLGGPTSDLVVQTPSRLYANFKSNSRQKYGSPSRFKGAYKIESIDIVGDVASMRLEIKHDTMKVTHQFSLMKFVDGWKIVSRVTSIESNQVQAKLE